MTRKNWLLIAFLVFLAGAYVYRFTDWIRPPGIQVEVSTRPSGRGASAQGVPPTLFLLDRDYHIDSLVVTGLSNVPPAQLGKPVWKLTATAKAEAQRGFEYGQPIPGFTVSRAPEPLVPGAAYQVQVTAGRQRGTRDFVAKSQAPAPGEE